MRTMTASLRAGVVALSLATIATPAAAEESPRTMAIELRAGFFTPQIDEQFEAATPYRTIFGRKPMANVGFQLEYQVWQAVGTVAVAGAASYAFVSGKARAESGADTSDKTTLHIVPLMLSLVYRFDYLAVNYDIPLVPYVKAGLSADIWIITDGKGDIASARGPGGVGKRQEGVGATFGYHAGAGLQILLDFLSPRMATEFDEEMGINNSYVFVEFLWNDVNDFYDPNSINLRTMAFDAGLMFEF